MQNIDKKVKKYEKCKADFKAELIAGGMDENEADNVADELAAYILYE